MKRAAKAALFYYKKILKKELKFLLYSSIIKEKAKEQNKMKVKTSKTIWIGKKAYFFLEAEGRKQRGCKPLSKEQKEKIWRRIKGLSTFKNGQYQITDNHFGGGDGTYNGKWWDWSIDTVIEMLEENGFKYRVGRKQEYIKV